MHRVLAPQTRLCIYLSAHPLSAMMSRAFKYSPAAVYMSLQVGEGENEREGEQERERESPSCLWIIGGLGPVSLFGDQLFCVLSRTAAQELLGLVKLPQVSKHLHRLKGRTQGSGASP